MSRRSKSANDPQHASDTDKVRIDKWLWAARFFKTRALAIEAIKGGKVSHSGQRVKPSKELQVGDELSIRQGYAVKTVIIKALSGKRGPAAQAALLYEETLESVQQRERLKAQFQAQPAMRRSGLGRPTKRERRQIVAFTVKS
ncbi:MAG: RNA-binding protein [Gammaproteobacteria bacterium]|jgi:ribosome-associated heat shock protein Hsp15|nr:RNA-binding protein [Gammaproteobacteria bacterium]